LGTPPQKRKPRIIKRGLWGVNRHRKESRRSRGGRRRGMCCRKGRPGVHRPPGRKIPLTRRPRGRTRPPRQARPRLPAPRKCRPGALLRRRGFR